MRHAKSETKSAGEGRGAEKGPVLSIPPWRLDDAGQQLVAEWEHVRRTPLFFFSFFFFFQTTA